MRTHGRLLLALTLALLLTPGLAAAGSGHRGTGTRRPPRHTHSQTSKPKATGTHRAARRTTHRSAAARHAFEVQSGFPHGRPGYVVDHIVPLACGGKDVASNMQWQTVAAGKAKDKVERRGC